jgi:acyl transferase domain-containing protein
MNSATISDPIAIIGLSSQFAGDATDTEKLWDVLLKGRPSPSPFLNDKHYHPDQSRQGAVCIFSENINKLATDFSQIHAKSAYFIKDDTKAFDSAFFGLTKKEVLSMDPQQRMLLESTYHALENCKYRDGLLEYGLDCDNCLPWTSGYPTRTGDWDQHIGFRRPMRRRLCRYV